MTAMALDGCFFFASEAQNPGIAVAKSQRRQAVFEFAFGERRFFRENRLAKRESLVFIGGRLINLKTI